MQARGDLNPPEGTKPMPPFEKWSFKKRNFLQYLTDLLHVRQLLTVLPLDQFDFVSLALSGRSFAGIAECQCHRCIMHWKAPQLQRCSHIETICHRMET